MTAEQIANAIKSLEDMLNSPKAPFVLDTIKKLKNSSSVKSILSEVH